MPHEYVDRSGVRRVEVLEALHKAACMRALGRDLDARFDGDTGRAWEAILAMDPTVNKRYLQWLVRQVESCRLTAEDFYKAPELIKELRRCAPMLKVANVSRDINHYSGLPALARVLRPFAAVSTERRLARAHRLRIEAETIVHHRCDQLLIVEPKTEDASCFWGRGTRWCTAAIKTDNAFAQYTKDGDTLFIYIAADGSKYQSCSDGTLCDQDDALIDWRNMPVNVMEAAFANEGVARTVIHHSPLAMERLPDTPWAQSLCKQKVQADGGLLRAVPYHFLSEELAEIAVRSDASALAYVPLSHRTQRVYELAIKKSGWALFHVPDEILTREMCDLAAQQGEQIEAFVNRHIAERRSDLAPGAESAAKGMRA